MAAVWKDYVSPRPAINTVVTGTRVSCVLADVVEGFNTRLTAEQDDAGDPLPPRTEAAYRREAMGAISRVTHQRVRAFVSKHETKSNDATEVFILEGPPRRQPTIVQLRSG